MKTGKRGKQRGATLVMVALSMIVLLGMTGLAIDLVSLYVGRGEAQRAADGAALAGATIFATSGCTSGPGGCIAGGAHETAARQRAIDVGTQNQVGGQTPLINASDIVFDYPTPMNPTITVTVARDTAHGNPMPTFFMRIFGLTSADISAAATAEAFNPSGSNIPVGVECLKPWVLPNCDWNRMVASSDPNHNPDCQDPGNPASYASYYVNNNQILHPGPTPGGVQGDLLTIKPGDPTQANTPGKFYPVFLPPGAVASICPACSSGGGGGGQPSGSLYRANIECCNQNTITCGQQTVQPITGNMVGPTRLGVECLIHQGGNGTGQDILNTGGPPWQITAGGSNPYFPAGSTPITASDSVVTVPIYNGSAMCPGMGGCGGVPVNIVGFMQMFIREVDRGAQGSVYAYVMNIVACGQGPPSGGGSNPTPISSGTGSPIPIRLIQRPGS